MQELFVSTWGGLIRPIPIRDYPDSMPLVDSREVPDEQIDFMLLRPRSFASFMAAMFFVDAMTERGKSSPKLILPFVPGARQDRLNSTGDYLFTAKSIANEINMRNFKSVHILDPHSEVIAALIDFCQVIQAADYIEIPPGKYEAVISPDAGAEKRAGLVARKLSVPLIHAWKTRDVMTGIISGFGVEPISLDNNARVLVVDDICDGGGTFVGLVDILDAAGLDAHLLVTHGLFTRGTAELLKRYSHVYCTDSVEGPREGVIEINVCEKLLTEGV